MNEEEETGRTIARLLDRSLNDVTPGTLYRLQAARRAALEHYQPAEKVLHAGVGISAQSGYHWLSTHAGRLLLTASLLLFLAIHSYWQMNNRVDDTILTPVILTNDPPIGSQEIEDTTNGYEAADEDTVEETDSREDTDHGNYDGEADTLETESSTNGTADSDDVTRSFDATEIQETENTAEAPYTTNYDQDSVTEEDTGVTSGDHLQNTEDTIDSYDTENTQDSTATIDE
ncbi:MAG: DUF3619 family protein [Nitrosomonas sp.]|nr:DUF3619 family protein [Nitrosomonas sp.]MDL1865109.1 DUF3619 family protein [Betaproteobacteria bacterium PRO5]